MKKIFISFVSSALIVFGMSSLSAVAAATCPFGGNPNWQGVCDTTTEKGESYFGPPMTEKEAKIYTENNSKPNTSSTTTTTTETSSNTNNTSISSTSTNTSSASSTLTPSTSTSSTSTTSTSTSSTPSSSISSSSTPTTSTSTTPTSISSTSSSALETVTSNPDLSHGYAAVDSNGNVLNVMVCSYNICGKDNNWLNLAISQGVFPQGTRLVLQTLRNSETGNVAGYMSAKYNNEKNIFTIKEPICAGTSENYVCNKEAIFQIPIVYPGSQELTCIQNCDIPIVEEDNDETSDNSTNEEQINSDSNQENNLEDSLIPMIFSTKLKSNTLATVIATNKNETKIWKTKVSKNGKIKINVDNKYKKWRFKVKVGS